MQHLEMHTMFRIDTDPVDKISLPDQYLKVITHAGDGLGRHAGIFSADDCQFAQ